MTKRITAASPGRIINVDQAVHAELMRRAGELQAATGKRVSVNDVLHAEVAATGAAEIQGTVDSLREARLSLAGRKVKAHLENFYQEHLPGCAAHAGGEGGVWCDCGMDDLRAALGD